MASLPATPEGLTDLGYSDLQSLAADHGYGRIVGEERADLVEFLAAEAYPRADGDDSADSVERDSDRQRQQRADGGSAAVADSASDSADSDAGVDAVEVGHEGTEKLSPEGAPEPDQAAVSPPDGVEDVLADASMSDIEPDPDAGRERRTGSDTDESADGASDDPADGDSADSDSGGGPLSALRSSDKSSEDIVEEADDPEERGRRAEVRERLEEAMDGGRSGQREATQEDVEREVDSADSADSAASGAAGTANGIVMNEEIVGSLIEMPFNTAASMTDWEGWELSKQEREANARLFVAMCDEQNVDLSATTMFALSMGSAFSGRAMQYRRQNSDSEQIEPPREPPADSASSETESADSGGVDSAISESDGSDSDDFDFSDSSTWD
ncbi:hypothetical protein [Halostella salina]|uniref:hypothetical protein n=1 Tax=Halostella salina TaxID=1547897 RepID=UPI0013CEA1DE|nr:hypothetical protein [Halostella salina]